MPDYNIYIHAIGTGTGTNNNPTTPWSQKDGGGNSNPTAAWDKDGGGNGSNFINTITKGASALSNPSSFAGSAISSAFKAFVIFEVAKAVIQTCLSIYSKHADWYAMQTGDYRESVKAANANATFNNIINPIALIIEKHRTETTWRKQNLKAEQERMLFGDSVINSYTNRGV